MKLQLNITQEQKDKLVYLAQSEGRSVTSYVLWHLGLTKGTSDPTLPPQPNPTTPTITTTTQENTL